MEKRRGKLEISAVLRVLGLVLFLYLFLLSIELMSSSFKMLGSGFAEGLFTLTSNPIIGLFIGILATSIVQSSSCTTSVVVGMVAAGVVPLRGAVPIIMGANIGTTVTNIIVSLAHITRPTEFKRAFAGAIVHDIFNLLSVIVLLPLESWTHYLEHGGVLLANIFSDIGGFKVASPLKIIVSPLAKYILSIFGGLIANHTLAGLLSLALALIVLFLSLVQIVKLMRRIVIGKVERLIHGYLFANALRSMVLGLIITAIIQSSSVVTSLAVPLVGAGILSIEQVFPYTLGANIGTTVTALLASLITQSPIAIAAAFVHLLFNLSGTAIWYPLRRVPITIAKKISNFVNKKRYLALVYLVIVFYGFPLLLIFLTQRL